MSDPIVAPNLSQENVDKAVTNVTAAELPFIPAKVRAGIYTVGGLITVITGSAALVVGGAIGRDLDLVSSAVGAIVATLAVAHVTK